MVDEEVEYLICCARMHRWLKWYLDLVATGLVVVTQHLLGRPQTRKNALGWSLSTYALQVKIF